MNDDQEKRIEVDDLGAKVNLVAKARRVVSLVPSLTEAIASTSPELLVGVTDFCVKPSDLEAVAGHEIARVRGPKNPALDVIKSLKPDLVVANQEENRRFDVDRLREAGVPVWVTNINSVDEAITSLTRLFVQGLGLNKPGWLSEAEQNWAEPDPPITTHAVVCIWRDPWMVIGPQTYVADVLRRCGVGLTELAIEDWRNARYPCVELEMVRNSGADHMLLMDQPYAFTAEDGPEAFEGMDVRIVSERPLAWYGPGLSDARKQVRSLVF